MGRLTNSVYVYLLCYKTEQYLLQSLFLKKKLKRSGYNGSNIIVTLHKRRDVIDNSTVCSKHVNDNNTNKVSNMWIIGLFTYFWIILVLECANCKDGYEAITNLLNVLHKFLVEFDFLHILLTTINEWYSLQRSKRHSRVSVHDFLGEKTLSVSSRLTRPSNSLSSPTEIMSIATSTCWCLLL